MRLILEFKCKTQDPKPCPAWIKLEDAEARGYTISRGKLRHEGPPTYLPCGTCGKAHMYTLNDELRLQMSGPQRP